MYIIIMYTHVNTMSCMYDIVRLDMVVVRINIGTHTHNNAHTIIYYHEIDFKNSKWSWYD